MLVSAPLVLLSRGSGLGDPDLLRVLQPFHEGGDAEHCASLMVRMRQFIYWSGRFRGAYGFQEESWSTVAHGVIVLASFHKPGAGAVRFTV